MDCLNQLMHEQRKSDQTPLEPPVSAILVALMPAHMLQTGIQKLLGQQQQRHMQPRCDICCNSVSQSGATSHVCSAELSHTATCLRGLCIHRLGEVGRGVYARFLPHA